MIEKFKTIDYFSATSDIWSRSNRSFIAVSVHYYEEKTLELQTSFIACESFQGHHTMDRVAQKLNVIFDRFGILEKVFFITTDGAAEYVAALKYNGDNYCSIHALTDEHDVDWLHSTDANTTPQSNDFNDNDTEPDSDYDIESDSDMIRIDTASAAEARTSFAGSEDEIRFIVHDIFEDEEVEALPLLRKMNRIACSSHRLDKVGKIDSLYAQNDPAYDAAYKRAFHVLEAIWDEKNSRLNAEIFTKITGRKLIGPHKIRWMKTYDAVHNFN